MSASSLSSVRFLTAISDIFILNIRINDGLKLRVTSRSGYFVTVTKCPDPVVPFFNLFTPRLMRTLVQGHLQ